MTDIQWSSANTPIWALVSGFPHRIRASMGLAMLQFFADESEKGQVMILAGYVSDAKSWAGFSDEWQECLDMHPRMKSFHMTDVIRASWSDATKERVSRFRLIAGKHAKAAMFVGIDLNAYKETFGRDKDWKNPYVFLFAAFLNVYNVIRKKSGFREKGNSYLMTRKM